MWTSDPWAILLTLAMGFGAGLIGYFGPSLWRSRSQTFQRWQEDIRFRAIRVIDTEAEAAEAKRELFEAIGELPKDFDPTMFLAVDLGTGIQRAVLFAAEERGLVQRGTFERIYQRPLPEPPSKLLEEQRLNAASLEVAAATEEEAPRSGAFDDIHAVAWSKTEDP